MDNNFDLTAALEYIDPASLDYQDWVNVGLALKKRATDKQSHEKECEFEGQCMNMDFELLVSQNTYFL